MEKLLCYDKLTAKLQDEMSKEVSMGYEENEQEIDLKELLFEALYKWRSLILAGIIGAILLGAYQCYSIVAGRAALEKAIEEGTVVEKDYDSKYLNAKAEMEKKLEERRKQSQNSSDLQEKINEAKNNIDNQNLSITAQKNAIISLEGQIENIQVPLQEAEDYLNNSVLLKVAEGKPVVKVAYHVDINGASAETFRDPVDEVVTAYYSPSVGSKEILELAEKYGLKTNLMSELYSVWGNTDSNLVFIQASGLDEAMAREILTVVTNLVEKEKKNITVAHTFRKAYEEVSCTRDTGLISKKTDYMNSILSYNDSIRSYNKSIDEANAAIDRAERNIANANIMIADYYEEKAECDEQVFFLTNEIAKMEEKMPDKLPSLATRWTSIIKFMIIGGIAGAAVLFMIYVALYVLRPMLRMPEDIRVIYGYPVLGVLNKKVGKKVNSIDKWLMKAEGRCKRPGDDEIIKTAAVSVVNTAEAGSRIAVLSTLKESKETQVIYEKLCGLVPDMKFECLTEGVTKAENVDMLSKCSAVILLEERNATSMGKLNDCVNQIKLFNKKVLGAIVL